MSFMFLTPARTPDKNYIGFPIMAYTPGKPRMASAYADASSPIASAAQSNRTPARGGSKLAPQVPATPALGSLSPMKASAVDHPKQRHVPTAG